MSSWLCKVLGSTRACQKRACCSAQEGLVPFNINVSVVGDIAIGVWFGHHNLGQRLHGRPSLSYAFHTAFLSAETMRVSLPSLDISNKRLFPADKATNFFMDVTLEDTDALPTAEYESDLTCYTDKITFCLQRCTALLLAHSLQACVPSTLSLRHLFSLWQSCRGCVHAQGSACI